MLQFRPRTVAPAPGQRRILNDPVEEHGEANDLSRYERAREEPDDFRHRMLANIAAFAFTVALTAIGIWLAMSIADLRRTQDCVLMGRRDCVRISTPHILAFFGPAVRLPRIRSGRSGPHSIELGAALRYTGTQLWAVDRAFRGVVAASSTVPEFILNISKA